jgi:hypothetical protein
MFQVGIKRAEFATLIEASIEQAASRMRDENREALREVAKTIPHVAFGVWWVSNEISCGCPAVEAKLASADGNFVEPAVEDFAGAFDDLSARYVRETVIGPSGEALSITSGIMVVE